MLSWPNWYCGLIAYCKPDPEQTEYVSIITYMDMYIHHLLCKVMGCLVQTLEWKSWTLVYNQNIISMGFYIVGS
jgi:hypothetical protein